MSVPVVEVGGVLERLVPVRVRVRVLARDRRLVQVAVVAIVVGTLVLDGLVENM